MKSAYNKAAKDHATTMSQAFFSATLRQCEKAKLDKDADRRAALRQCQHCYYLRNSIAGQAFTQYICAGCLKTRQHPNTCVPALCPKCSDKWHACSRCGGDLVLSICGIDIIASPARPNLQNIAIKPEIRKVARYTKAQSRLLKRLRKSKDRAAKRPVPRKAKRHVAS